MKEKKKIMLHIIMPNQISGPNTSVSIILSSKLNNEYEFASVEQRYHAGGMINFRLIGDLYRQIMKFDPDLVHLSGLQASGFHAAIAAKMARKKILLAVRGFSIDAIGLSSFRKCLYSIAETITLMLADNVYTVCESAKNREQIQRHSKKVLNTVYNAAPTVNEEIFQKKNQKRIDLGLRDDDIVIVISGRMTEDKGIFAIIKAIQLQRENAAFAKCRYLLAGDGPAIDVVERELSEELNSGRVLCLGKRSDVLELLVASDIFLFGTLHENLSNALLEAMACGLPVIVTNVGGNPEVVRNNENGYLIPANDPYSICDALLQLISNKEKRKQFGTASKSIIAEKFSKEILYKKLGTIYKRMLDP